MASCKLFSCHTNDVEETAVAPEPTRTPVQSCPTTPRAKHTRHLSVSTQPTTDHIRSQSGSTMCSTGTTLSSPSSVGKRASKKFSLLADQVSQRGSGLFTRPPLSPSSSFTVLRPAQPEPDANSSDIPMNTCESIGCKQVSRIIADCIVAKLCAFPVTNRLCADIDELVSKADGWDEALARCIHHQLLRLLCAHAERPDMWPLSDEMKTALAAATIAFNALQSLEQERALRHSVFAQAITLGVLSQVLPGVIFHLGFQDFGLVPGSWASQYWKRCFGHIVSAGSLLKYLRTFGTLHGQQPAGF